MSIGVFDVASFGDDEEKVRKQAAQDKLAAATYDVREKHGPWLFGAHDREAFHDRAKLAYVDICKTIEPHLHARLGVYKKVLKTLEREWREASTRRTADDSGLNFNGGDPYTPPDNSGTIVSDGKGGVRKVGPDNSALNFNFGKPYMDPASGRTTFSDGKGGIAITPLPGDQKPPVQTSGGVASTPENQPAAGSKPGGSTSGPAWSARSIGENSIPKGDYTVQQGDTLGNISKGMGVGLSDLESANSGAMGSGTNIGKNPDLIHPGDVIHAPGGAASPPAPAAPASGLSQPGIPKGGRRYYAEFEEEHDHPEVDNHSTYEPHTYDRLEPEGDFESYKDRVDQGADDKVERDFVGPDSRSSSPYEVREHDDDGDHNFVARRRMAAPSTPLPTTIKPGARMYSQEFYRISRLLRADQMSTAPQGAPTLPPQGGAGTGTTPMPPSTTPSPDPMAMNPAQPMMPMASREFQIISSMMRSAAPGDPTTNPTPSTGPAPTRPAPRIDSAPTTQGGVKNWGKPTPDEGGPGMDQYSGVYDGEHALGGPKAFNGLSNSPAGGSDSAPPSPGSSMLSRGGRRLLADRNYLQQADEALTKVLNEKAQEFQETIAPLQQALVTIQQAEQLTNPMNVSPPAGTVNVMPQQPGGAPQGGQPPMDPSQGGMPPQADPSQQMMARRRFARLHQAKNCTCWEGYKRVPGTKPCAEGSCEKCDTHRKESARRRQASGGDWVHPSEVKPGDLVSWEGSRNPRADRGIAPNRGRVKKVTPPFQHPNGSEIGGHTLHFEGGGSLSHADKVYRHDFGKDASRGRRPF